MQIHAIEQKEGERKSEIRKIKHMAHLISTSGRPRANMAQFTRMGDRKYSPGSSPPPPSLSPKKTVFVVQYRLLFLKRNILFIKGQVITSHYI